MNLWLRYLIFGNGFGLPPRDHDTTWFILSGRAYRWIGGYGAQLRSFEWRRPRVGDERILAGLAFRPFNYSRCWFLYDISWAASEFSGPLSEAQEKMSAFRTKLGSL